MDDVYIYDVKCTMELNSFLRSESVGSLKSVVPQILHISGDRYIGIYFICPCLQMCIIVFLYLSIPSPFSGIEF